MKENHKKSNFSYDKFMQQLKNKIFFNSYSKILKFSRGKNDQYKPVKLF